MSNNIVNKMRAKIKQGGVRPNKFRVDMVFPSVVATDLTEECSFLIKGAELPGQTFGKIQVPIRGRNVNVKGEREADGTLDLTILNVGFEIYDAFHEWLAYMEAMAETIGEDDPNAYIVTFQVHQLNARDEPIKTFEFYNAWPESIGTISLDTGSTNTIEEFSVTMSYDYFEIL